MRYLTKSRYKLALECPVKLFYTGKMVDDGIWHHLAAVYVNKIVTGIYVDGISYPFTTLTDGTVTSMSNPLSVRIGTDQTNEYMFRGNISQVQLYNFLQVVLRFVRLVPIKKIYSIS